MSRSRRRRSIHGLTCAASEKADKQAANRRLRRAVRVALDREAPQLPHRRGLGNPWLMAKDGKSWFDPADFPRLMRK